MVKIPQGTQRKNTKNTIVYEAKNSVICETIVPLVVKKLNTRSTN